MATVQQRRALSPAQQALGLRFMFPLSNVTVSPVKVMWIGTIRPTPMSGDYRVRLAYVVGRHPSVHVLDPPLDPLPYEYLPHMFNDGSLCLHEDHEWTPGHLIVDTIVPWAAEWLAHYEIWKATGLWYGDGAPQSVEDIILAIPAEKSQNRASRRASRHKEPRVLHGG